MSGASGSEFEPPRAAPLGLDPDLAATGAAMRAEWRVEEEQFTAAAHEQWRHERTLTDRAHEWMLRGDTVTAHCAGAVFRGTVLDVRDDLIAIKTTTGRVDVALGVVEHRRPVSLVIEAPATSGGAWPGVGAATFRDRLIEIEAAQQAVRIGTSLTADELRGTLAVGRDHVSVHQGQAETVLPLDWIAWVAPADAGY
jgi:hypothetical protein